MLIVFIASNIFWLNLPFSIKRSSDIKLGEAIIRNIESYQSKNGLPDNTDWNTLKKLGFKDENEFSRPPFRKLDKKSFELIYVEGFDGPYLMWNLKERIW